MTHAYDEFIKEAETSETAAEEAEGRATVSTEQRDQADKEIGELADALAKLGLDYDEQRAWLINAIQSKSVERDNAVLSLQQATEAQEAHSKRAAQFREAADKVQPAKPVKTREKVEEKVEPEPEGWEGTGTSTWALELNQAKDAVKVHFPTTAAGKLKIGDGEAKQVSPGASWRVSPGDHVKLLDGRGSVRVEMDIPDGA